MNFRSSLLSLLSSLLLLLLSTHVTTQEGPIFECIDNLTDMYANQWEASSGMYYAETVLDLPTTFRDKFTETGIFYVSRVTGSDRFGNIFKRVLSNEDILPVLLYVRYSSHILVNKTGEFEKQAIFAYPAMIPDFNPVYKHLPFTSQFEWAEELVPVNPDNFQYSMGVRGGNFHLGEYLFIDKIIVAQGYPQDFTIENMKDLCRYNEVPLHS